MNEELMQLLSKLTETVNRQGQNQDDLLKALVNGLSGGAKAKPTRGSHPLLTKQATSEDATRLYGPAGILSIAGLDPDVITARITPVSLADMLPVQPSNYDDPRFGSITGITAPVGSQPSAICADAPRAYMKGCNLTARFGLLRMDTGTIDTYRTGLLTRRSEFTDLILRGGLLGNTGLRPDVSEDVLSAMTISEMLIASAALEVELVRQLWQGTVAVANEFPGLDAQIATGQVDADTGTACASLDSDVKDFNYQDVSTASNALVRTLSMMEYYLRHNATRMRLLPVEWVIAMRPDLAFAVTEHWPCSYLTDRCSNSAGAQVAVVNDRTNVDMRAEMREGKFLWINGRQVPYVEDDGIFEHNSTNNANLQPGSFASAIYFVPLTILGSFPVTYREHLDYASPTVRANVAAIPVPTSFWTSGGAYGWALEEEKWCIKLALRTEQRVVLRVPQLAGKLDHVAYSPIQKLRDSNPSSSYWYDGGVSMRNTPGSYSAIWNS